MSLGKKVALNTIVQFTGKIISTAIGVVTVALMARYLGAQGYGQYSTVVAYVQLFGILADLGLSLTVVRLMSDPQEETEHVINNVLTIRLFTAALFLGIAPLAVLLFPYESVVKLGVLIASFSFFFASLTQIFTGLFQKELRTDKATVAEVLGRIALLGIVVWTVFADTGLLFMFVAMVIGSLLTVVVNYMYALRYVRVHLAFDLQLWKKIFHTTWPIAISIAFNLIYFKADTLILSLTRSQTEVGIYSAPYRVLEILTTFPFLFMGIVLPILTVRWASGQMEEFRHIYQRAFDFLIMAALPLIFGTYFVADKLMMLIAGPEFEPSGFVLRLIIIATAIIFVNTLFSYNIIVINKQRQMIWAYVGAACLALTLYIIFIPTYSYVAAALITILIESIIFVINAVISTKTVGFFPGLSVLAKTLFASMVMCIPLYFLDGLPVLITISVGMITYFIALLAVRGIPIAFFRELITLQK